MSCDLHTHTKLSDGSLGIEELIVLAKRRGLTALAVTDHDTVAAATRAVNIGRRQGINVIHGVELSTWDYARERRAHLLCYLSEYPDRLEGLCRRVAEGRKKTAVEMVRKVMRYYPISTELIMRCATGSTNIYKQHIMHALMDAGYADSIYGEVYEKLFGPEGVAKATVIYPDVHEVLQQIHEAGGIAVLAHPYQYDSIALMEELTAEGLDGVEAYHPSNDEQRRTQLLAYAADHGLLATGGSDFHGMYTSKPRPLGSAGVPDEAAQALVAYRDKHRKTVK
jgi:predicted metal-dependent phosphoesterase TrpH